MANTLWVIAGKVNGKRQPVMLVDTHTPALDKKDILRIDISQRMADEEIPVQVPECSFVKSFIDQGLLEVTEGLNAKTKSTKFMDSRAKEIQELKKKQELDKVLKAEVAVEAIKSLLEGKK